MRRGTSHRQAGVDAGRLAPDEALAYAYSGARALSHLLGLPHVHIADNTIDFTRHDTGGEVSAYVQDDVQLHHRVTVNGGVRVDPAPAGPLQVALTGLTAKIQFLIRAVLPSRKTRTG